MIKNKVAHNSSKTILDEVNSLDHYLQTIVQAIELRKNWNEQEALNLEIKKSFVRGLIRYSLNSFKLIEFLCRDLNNLSKKDKDPIRWATPFYPMIHLSNDKVEGGSFHNDNLDMKNFFTCWIPLTNYNYPALSIFPFQNKIINLISRFIIKLKLSNFFSKKINVKKGDYLIWDGLRIHSGNINSSNLITCALQIKFTSEIYSLEPSISIFSDFKENPNFLNFDEFQIKKQFNIFLKMILDVIDVTKNNNNIDEEEMIEKFYIYYSRINKPTSFALSVLAQRILTHSNILLKNCHPNFQVKKIIKLLDLLSVLSGSSNLTSVKRLLKEYSLVDLQKKIKKFDRFNSFPSNSYQVQKLIDPNIFLQNKEVLNF